MINLAVPCEVSNEMYGIQSKYFSANGLTGHFNLAAASIS